MKPARRWASRCAARSVPSRDWRYRPRAIGLPPAATAAGWPCWRSTEPARRDGSRPLVYERGYGFLREKVPLLSGLFAVVLFSFLFATWAELRSLGLLARPKHRPAWLESWSTLLPYFAFASFMDSVDLAPVEQHYRQLSALAAAAQPKRS